MVGLGCLVHQARDDTGVGDFVNNHLPEDSLFPY